MRYTLTVEGGFTGIPRTYQGEVHLPLEDKEKLLKAIGSRLDPVNKKLRDGLSYNLKLEDAAEAYEVTYDDSNLPSTVRNLVATIVSG